ncbi:MAG: hypothetical protein BroJett040_25590 [Oligoflexia bacterium]|nr:MAG: hypothetical protein BroJett040_25590 [Oligoflexia bacterium]
MIRFSLFILSLCISLFCLAEEGSPESYSDFESAFQGGVSAFREKNYAQASAAFTKSLDFQSSNVAAMTNLALAQYHMGQKGLAIGLLRKSISLDPDFSTSRQALKFILSQMEIKEIPHEITTMETLRSSVLVHLSLPSLLIITALLLGAMGWALLTYMGLRRKANKEERAYPPFPSIGLLFALGFFIFFTLSLLKVIDHLSPRGTITVEKTAVYALPDEKSTALFDLFAGLEVIIEQRKNDWVQVTYPGGQTGWIPEKTIIITAGRSF